MNQRRLRLEQMIDMNKQMPMTAIIMGVLALGMIVWGWTRAHGQIEQNEVSTPKVLGGLAGP